MNRRLLLFALLWSLAAWPCGWEYAALFKGGEGHLPALQSLSALAPAARTQQLAQEPVGRLFGWLNASFRLQMPGPDGQPGPLSPQLSLAIADALAQRVPAHERAGMARALLRQVARFPQSWPVQTAMDRAIDRLLGMSADQVTERIRNLSPEEVARRYGGEQTWHDYDNDMLLTPYFEFRLALDHLKPKPGQTVVDLGSGMGRMGLYVGLLHPGVKFHGYEIVGERVQEGSRAAQELGLQGIQFHEQNMADPNWKPVPADIYYAFNPVSDGTFDKMLGDLRSQAIAHNKPFRLAVSGPAPFFKLERESAWLREVTPPPRFQGDDFTRIFEFDPTRGSRDVASVTPVFPASRPFGAADQSLIEGLRAKQSSAGLSLYSFPWLWATSKEQGLYASEMDGMTLLHSREADGTRVYREPLGGSVQQRAQAVARVLAWESKARFEDLSAEVGEAVARLPGLHSAADTRFSEYVYSLRELAELQATRDLRYKAKSVQEFMDAHPKSPGREGVEFFSLREHPELIPELSVYLDHWMESRTGKDAPDGALVQEVALARRLGENFRPLNLQGGVLKVNGQIVGYTLGAPLDAQTFAIYVEKADGVNFKGSYQALNQFFAKELLAQGYQWVNRQDDGGVPGLRQAKRSYHPQALLPNYTATRTAPP